MTFLSKALQYLAAISLVRGAAESQSSAAGAGEQDPGRGDAGDGDTLAGRSISSMTSRTSPLGTRR